MSNLNRTKAKMHILNRIFQIEKDLIRHMSKTDLEKIQAQKRDLLVEKEKEFINSELKLPTIVSRSFLD